MENLIDGLITIEKLDLWFNSLSKKDKLAALYGLSFDYTETEWQDYVDVCCKNTKRLSDYDDVVDIKEYWNDYSNDNMNYKKLYIYLDYNKILVQNILSCLDKNVIFYFLNKRHKVKFLNLDERMGWKYEYLVSTYNMLSDDEKEKIFESASKINYIV